MFKPRDFYTYFKSCFQLDNQLFQVDNVLSTKYTYKWFARGKEELLHDVLPLIPFPHPKIEELKKELQFKALETQLFYGCFILLGKQENEWSRDQRMVAPLLLFPAAIFTKEDLVYLSIEREEVIINPVVLSKLTERFSGAKDEFVKAVTDAVNATDLVSDLWGILLNKYFEGVEMDEVLMYPKLWSRQKISRSFSTENKEGYQLVPGACTIVAQKSINSLKVVNDLDAMGQSNVWSSCLQDIIEKKDRVNVVLNKNYASTRLNAEQNKALLNASTYTNSVIIGPPGTGKSYTIANVVTDILLNDKSVLLVSKSKQAVDVLKRILAEEFDLGKYMVNTSSPRYKYSLLARLKRYLNGIYEKGQGMSSEFSADALLRKKHRLERKFRVEVERELELCEINLEGLGGWQKMWRKLYLESPLLSGAKIQALQQSIDTLTYQINQRLQQFTRRKLSEIKEKNIVTQRKVLSDFYDALDQRNFTQFKTAMEKLETRKLLKVFPLWLVNLSELNSVLPLQKDAFDYVIIDEATQCDIALALPALYRAKRAVVVGDPNQLKHYSFVARDAQRKLRADNNLPDLKIFDYRDRSVLDLFVHQLHTQNQLSFLQEHFRSTPSIISFSNEHFYEGLLKVIKSTPQQKALSNVHLLKVDGTRNKEGVNEIEIEKTIAIIKGHLAKYKGLESIPKVGVISPFSAQSKALQKAMKQNFSLEEIKRLDLFCGTPYQFQGSERDLVILSMCVDDTSHASAFRHLNKAEVFNVAITRAKSFQYVIHSLDKHLRTKEDYLTKFIHHIYEGDESVEDVKDAFQEDVKKLIEQEGWGKVYLSYPIAGSLLDVLVVKEDKSYFIDLIGYPGKFKEAFTLERYQTLLRAGIPTLPLRYSYWKDDLSDAMNSLKEFLEVV